MNEQKENQKEETKKRNSKIGQIVIKNLKWIIVVIGIALFLDVVKDIFANEIHVLDSRIYAMVSYFSNPMLTSILKVITNLGSATVVISICVATLFTFKNRNYAKYLSLNLGIIFCLNQVLKHIFQRPRPTEFQMINETGYSFPSAHAMVSTAFYGFAIYLVYKYVENKHIKWALCTILSVLVFVIGISRIYLGVHYASDVIGGFCFSVTYLILYIQIVAKKVETKE